MRVGSVAAVRVVGAMGRAFGNAASPTAVGLAQSGVSIPSSQRAAAAAAPCVAKAENTALTPRTAVTLGHHNRSSNDPLPAMRRL